MPSNNITQENIQVTFSSLCRGARQIDVNGRHSYKYACAIDRLDLRKGDWLRSPSMMSGSSTSRSAALKGQIPSSLEQWPLLADTEAELEISIPCCLQSGCTSIQNSLNSSTILHWNICCELDPFKLTTPASAESSTALVCDHFCFSMIDNLGAPFSTTWTHNISSHQQRTYMKLHLGTDLGLSSFAAVASCLHDEMCSQFFDILNAVYGLFLARWSFSIPDG